MRHLAFLFAFAVSACAQFNDQCTPLVENPEARVAYIAEPIHLDRPNARHANNAVGQQAADAMVWVFQGGSRPAGFAVVNGGGLRAEGLCVTRNTLPRGELTDGVLHEIMLFANLVKAVDLTEDEVLDMFERAVSALTPAPGPIASPAGLFLQVSTGVELHVDCAATPRVSTLRINGEALTRPGRALAEKRFRLATNDYLMGGGDGYSMLAEAQEQTVRDTASAQRFGGVDSDITSAWLQQSAFNTTQDNGLRVEERIHFTNCAPATAP